MCSFAVRAIFFLYTLNNAGERVREGEGVVAVDAKKANKTLFKMNPSLAAWSPS